MSARSEWSRAHLSTNMFLISAILDIIFSYNALQQRSVSNHRHRSGTGVLIRPNFLRLHVVRQ